MDFSSPNLKDCDYGSILDLLISDLPVRKNYTASTMVKDSPPLDDSSQELMAIQLDQTKPLQSTSNGHIHSESLGNIDTKSSGSNEKGSSSSRRPRRRTSYELERNKLYCAEWRIRKKQEDDDIKRNHEMVVRELQELKHFVEQLQKANSLKNMEITALRQRVAQLESQQKQN